MTDIAGAIRRRRAIGYTCIAALLVLDVVAMGFLGGSERLLAIVRSVVLPGLPFLEWQPVLGVLTIATALSAVAAWLRFGADWLLALVVVSAAAVAAFVMPLHHHDAPDRAPHVAPHRDDVQVERGVPQGREDGTRQEREAAPHDHHDHDHAHTHPHANGAGVLQVASRESADAATARWRTASHEFTVVLVVFALVARLRVLLARLPGAHALLDRVPDAWRYPAVAIARAAAITLSNTHARDDADARAALRDPRLIARATWVNRIARWRWRGDPLTGAHAPLRAALSLGGVSSPAQRDAFVADAHVSHAGVPASEPTWVRLLDGMLAAIALDDLGERASVARWRTTLATRFALHHGRRPAALHTPTMLAVGTATDWEHAAATALAFARGWAGSDDWPALRPRCLAAAASDRRDAATLRLVAAGRYWAELTDDGQARDILGRRTVEGDDVAVALLACAASATVQRTNRD